MTDDLDKMLTALIAKKTQSDILDAALRNAHLVKKTNSTILFGMVANTGPENAEDNDDAKMPIAIVFAMGYPLEHNETIGSMTEAFGEALAKVLTTEGEVVYSSLN